VGGLFRPSRGSWDTQNTSMLVHVGTQLPTHMLTYTHVHVHSHIDTHVPIHMQTHMCTQMHSHAYKHICNNAPSPHTHTCWPRIPLAYQNCPHQLLVSLAHILPLGRCWPCPPASSWVLLGPSLSLCLGSGPVRFLRALPVARHRVGAASGVL
jgi:hypothetical protein